VDCVYVCRDGNNEELRYSIRSIEKNLPHTNIWVVGGKPHWYTGRFIQLRPIGGAYKNVRNSLKTIIDSKEISDTFILMNDDFFVMKPLENLKYYYSGSLDEKVRSRFATAPQSMYTMYLGHTQNELRKAKVENALDYELHVPMIFEKEKLSKVVNSPGLWRSMYGNLNNVGGEQMDDVKIYSKGISLNEHDVDIENSTFLSSDDQMFLQLKTVMQDRFPEPSSCE
jgi:hypothetical protein